MDFSKHMRTDCPCSACISVGFPMSGNDKGHNFSHQEVHDCLAFYRGVLQPVLEWIVICHSWFYPFLRLEEKCQQKPETFTKPWVSSGAPVSPGLFWRGSMHQCLPRWQSTTKFTYTIFESWSWTCKVRTAYQGGHHPPWTLLSMFQQWLVWKPLYVFWIFDPTVSVPMEKKRRFITFLLPHLTMMLLPWFMVKSIDPCPFFFKLFSSVMSQSFTLIIWTVPMLWIPLSFSFSTSGTQVKW